MKKFKFKFGHRVEVRDNENEQWEKAKFVKKGAILYWVLLDDRNSVDTFKHIRLDMEATEFLRGDEVEVRDSEKHPWEKAVYEYNDFDIDYPHNVCSGGGVYPYKYCRYPKLEVINAEPVIITISGKDYEIREVER